MCGRHRAGACPCGSGSSLGDPAGPVQSSGSARAISCSAQRTIGSLCARSRACSPSSPTGWLNHPQTSWASFQCNQVVFFIKKTPTNGETKPHTFVKAEMFHRAVSFGRTFAKSWAEFWWQPARFPNPSPSRQPQNPGSQDASGLPGLAAPQPRAFREATGSRIAFPCSGGRTLTPGTTLHGTPCCRDPTPHPTSLVSSVTSLVCWKRPQQPSRAGAAREVSTDSSALFQGEKRETQSLLIFSGGLA